MARYFQHINPTDVNFNNITELDYIDDSDKDFILYYFKDGTKCTPTYIGKLNDQTAFDKQMELAEISSPNNKWEFEVKIIEPKQKTGIDSNGNTVIIPDPYMDNNQKGKPKIALKSAPYKSVSMNNEPDKMVSVVNKAKQIEQAADIQEFVPVESCNKEVETQYIAVEPNLDTEESVDFIYKGRKVNVLTSNIIESMFKPKVAQEKVDTGLLAIKASGEHKKLLESMISMAKKETCEISIGITLNIPSTSLYNLVANDYEAGLSDDFVKIIANKIKANDLRAWVVAGLNAYYKGEFEEEEELQNFEEPKEEIIIPETKVKTKKATKTKKA